MESEELEELKTRLKRMYDYHIEEYAYNLKEIGGPGVGGLELEFFEHSIESADTEDEMRLMALQTSIYDLWNEAAMCFVHNQFRASILLFAVLTEAVLKLEIEKKNREFSASLNRMTLGGLIRNLESPSKKLELPENIINILREINKIRNDVVHLNRERRRPESIFRHIEEDEIKPIKASKVVKDGWLTGDDETISISFGKGYSIIYLYKNATRKMVKNVKELLKYLYA